MPRCHKCGKIFPGSTKVNGKLHTLIGRKKCLDCLPIPSHIKKAQAVCICSECGKTSETPICEDCAIIQEKKECRLKALEYKGPVCVVCGYDKCKGALLFHHLGSNYKLNQFDDAYQIDWPELTLEPGQSVVVCRNCLAEINEGIVSI